MQEWRTWSCKRSSCLVRCMLCGRCAVRTVHYTLRRDVPTSTLIPSQVKWGDDSHPKRSVLRWPYLLHAGSTSEVYLHDFWFFLCTWYWFLQTIKISWSTSNDRQWVLGIHLTAALTPSQSKQRIINKGILLQIVSHFQLFLIWYLSNLIAEEVDIRTIMLPWNIAVLQPY